MDPEDKIHDYLEVTSKCDHDVLLKNVQELKPIYLPMSLLKAITKNFSDGLQIGSGGFAVVYKGLLKRGGTVAVKKLLNTICMDDNQFQKEVSCLMKVRHKNIVRFLGYCADTQGKMEDYQGKFVLADERERLLCFEYLPNGSLEKYINDASGGLEWNKRYKIINGICEGLQYLHENNIVHLDLKPANILLNDNMVPKISDFGQSRCFEEMQSRTVTSALIGSIGYLAPEFFSGEITRKLDIYSLGVIIGEMLTGQKGHSPVENVLECWRKRFGESYPDTDKLLEQVRVCTNIRISCGKLDPTERPDIQQITTILNELSNSDEFPKNNRKRKQPTSSGPANSTGTGNTVGPANSPPSTPSTHTPGDGLGMGGNMRHVPQNLMIYGANGTGLASSSNQMDDLEQFGDVGSLDDNVESFLSNDDGDHRDIVAALKRSPAEPNPAASKGFTFSEVNCWRPTNNKLVCCHFSSDGKILARAGHEKRAILWNMENFQTQHMPEEHSLIITDVCFRPNSSQLATSSFDRTIKLWDAADPRFSLHTFTGHSQAISLDFHPKRTDLLCSCDDSGEIRYWNVIQFTCLGAIKGGCVQVRFQPHVGQFLAAADFNVVSIFDIETHEKKYTLQGHNTNVQSVCWDNNGEYIASVSQDLVKVWSISSGECIHELSSNGNKFFSCVFHPSYSHVLVIGGYQSLEVWNMVKNHSLTVQAHEGLIAALAQSPVTGMVASVSHDNSVKLWK